MSSVLIVNATLVNEGKIFESDLFIKNGRIDQIGKDLSGIRADKILDASGKYLIPGIIDDQVHFREPGLTHKATVYTESKAAVAGGITSYMEMPNTIPNTVTQELLEEKYILAASQSLANYSFYMGATNENLEEVLKTDKRNVCGIKIFMGSSTGNMLVDQTQALEKIFSEADLLIATHCEDEATIRENMRIYKEKFGEDILPSCHAEIRSAEACFKSSSLAVELAKKNNTRLHVLHISTGKELSLFRNDIPLKEKRITSEVCIHHLWFSKDDYAEKGNFIKWNPSVKEGENREALWQALLEDKLDVIATDHAPHTLEEKSRHYWQAPSGGPLVQHSLVAMLECYHQGKISLEKIVEKMAHSPAVCFQVAERGFIREGYKADLVLVDLNAPWTVSKENILYKCGWSPFEGTTFQSRITHTLISGHLAFEEGNFHEEKKGERLRFER